MHQNCKSAVPARTVIYGTLGPSCADRAVLTEMFRLGMNGVRLNLSHVTLSESAALIETMHAAAADAGVRPELLIDLQGPELRIGKLGAPLLLTEGEHVLLTADKMPARTTGTPFLSVSKENGAGSSAALLPQIPVPDMVLSALKPGQQILLDDGKLLLEVLRPESLSGTHSAADLPDSPAFEPVSDLPATVISAHVLRGGTLQSRKSIALPGISLRTPTLTAADLENLKCAADFGVTAVMQPFVRDRADLETVKRAILDAKTEYCRRIQTSLPQDQASEPRIRLFAKIENLDGVSQIDSLIPAADEIVIARGDLGNAVPLWELPGVQKTLSRKCRAAGKPFMVVTQMLASMEHAAVPTRAEVSDIFNAVLDGAASVMVTGETAAGAYPVEVIRYLVNTVREAEKYREIHS